MKSEDKSQNVQLPSEPHEMFAVRMSFPCATSCKVTCVCLGLVSLFVLVLFSVTPLLRWLTEPLGTGVHRQTNQHWWTWSHAAWWHQVSSSGVPCKASQKEREILVPTVPQPWRLTPDSLTISNTRKAKCWEKMPSPAHLGGTAARGFQVLLQTPCSPLKQGRQFRKPISNKKRKNPRCSRQFYFPTSGMGGSGSSPMPAAGWGVGASPPRRPQASSPRSSAMWAARPSGWRRSGLWRGGAPWDTTTSAGPAGKSPGPVGPEAREFPERTDVPNHPEKGP